MEKMQFMFSLGKSIKAGLIALSMIAALSACDSNLDSVEQNVAERKSTLSKDNQLSNARISKLCGFQGLVYNQAITAVISNTIITFSKTDEVYVVTATSDAYGTYQATLKPGKYYVTATATGYNSYSSSPGVFVCTGNNGYQTGNFFLENEVAGGYQGIAFDASDFNITIANTYITFADSGNAGLIFTTFSGAYGEYKMNLPQGSYYVTAQASGYKPFESTPGLFVVTGQGYQTGNFFLDALVAPSR
jgi:hypothetical protein